MQHGLARLSENGACAIFRRRFSSGQGSLTQREKVTGISFPPCSTISPAMAGTNRFATSPIRLTASSGDARTVPMLLKAIKDPSPLVRAAAAEALQGVPAKEAAQALAEAAGDDYRLVRVRAAASLAGLKDLPVKDAEKQVIEKADAEYRDSLMSRPDQWDSYYNLGNYYASRADFKQAVVSYDTALKLEPRAMPAMVNESMAYAQIGEIKKRLKSPCGRH